MARRWKTRAERKKRYEEVLEKAERSKARVRAAQTRPLVSKKPKVQAKKSDFKKMEPIAEEPKKPVQDTGNSYGMSLVRASEVADNARLQRAFGRKAKRETSDEPARVALCGTVVEASEPAESSTEHRTDSVLQDEIRRIEEELCFEATGETPKEKTHGRWNWFRRNEKILMRTLILFDIVAWSFITPKMIGKIIGPDRETTVVIPEKDSDLIVMPRRSTVPGIDQKMLERRQTERENKIGK